MRKMSKKIVLVLVLMLVALIIPSMVLATNPSNALNNSTNVDVSAVQSIGGSVVTIVGSIASVVSILILIILGIKYMMGSAEEKAEYKKTLIPYFVGAILVFAAGSIASGVYNAANSML